MTYPCPKLFSGNIEIRPRRDTFQAWHDENPVLREHELAWESDTDRFKKGDGKTPWRELPYYVRDFR
jgi:hypothetical protein